MSAECEEVRRVVAAVLEGAVASPHAAACTDCGAAIVLERATRDRIRSAAPSRGTASAPRRARGSFPAKSLAAAVLLGAVSWLAPLAGGVPRAAGPRKQLAPGRAEPEWSLLHADDASPTGPFSARRSLESGLNSSEENR